MDEIIVLWQGHPRLSLRRFARYAGVAYWQLRDHQHSARARCANASTTMHYGALGGPPASHVRRPPALPGTQGAGERHLAAYDPGGSGRPPTPPSTAPEDEATCCIGVQIPGLAPGTASAAGRPPTLPAGWGVLD